MSELARALADQEEGLLTCVHCGFCLPACPTYVRLGDENDSPRGRLHLMRAVAEGRMDPGADAFQEHVDRCLGCRACEPVCPSGVPYGELLELARQESVRSRRPGALTRLLLRVFRSAGLTAAVLALGRRVRGLGLPALLARRLPSSFPRLRLGAGMLAASSPALGDVRARAGEGGAPSAPKTRSVPERPAEAGPSAALLRGCVQAGLFGRVGEASRRVLELHGVTTQVPPGQGCCGALHAHGGDLETARALARANIDAFLGSGADLVVVDAAGCGAAMKGYGHLLDGDPEYGSRARILASRVRDVSEVLEERGVVPGARLGPRELPVAWDPPCHLLHAQGVEEPPRSLLDAIPGLRRVPLARASECCGGAGIYGMTHPELGGEIGADKVEAVRTSGARVVATANPGCIMQIGAGLRMAGDPTPVLHPVELLDESYRRAGYYGGPAPPARNSFP